MTRLFGGLSIGSGLEGVDVALIRTSGIGIDLAPRVVRAARLAFPPNIRELLQRGVQSATLCETLPGRDHPRAIAETALHALRSAVVAAGVSQRELFAIGWLEPARPPATTVARWSGIVEWIAEQTGITMIYRLRSRDQTLGGSGHPITALADFLLLRDPTRHRLLLHLGAVASILSLPPSAKLSEISGFDAGPGNQWLDALLFHGTRGRERLDPGGKKAVQGCCHEPLLAHWLDHPHLSRRPPKTLHPDAFGRDTLLAVFETARQLGVGLTDLLCTGTHFVVQAMMKACSQLIPDLISPQIVISGGGVRNGFLVQLLRQQFKTVAVEMIDNWGVPALARNACGAATLAALTCDGVAGNLPQLTGAAGSRVLGSFVPGDTRNWARCLAWLAEQVTDPMHVNRAA